MSDDVWFSVTSLGDQMNCDFVDAAKRGAPSVVWRAGQDRRLQIMLSALSLNAGSRLLVNGCGLGLYMREINKYCSSVHGLDIEVTRLLSAVVDDLLVAGQCEHLPYSDNSFDGVISHEVLEHVVDDYKSVHEIVRVLRKPDNVNGIAGGRAIIFVPNKLYPFETHGLYWRNKYYFGNFPLVNYLPSKLRNFFVPHVRAYLSSDIIKLFDGLQIKIVSHTVIFGGYDNLVARWPIVGGFIRTSLHALEHTVGRWVGLSHVVVIEKI